MFKYYTLCAALVVVSANIPKASNHKKIEGLSDYEATDPFGDSDESIDKFNELVDLDRKKSAEAAARGTQGFFPDPRFREKRAHSFMR